MSPQPGDLVQLTSNRGAVSIGILMEEKHLHRSPGAKAPPTMVIWKVLIPQGCTPTSVRRGGRSRW